jgi:SAM-dependent methyltransferase
LAGVAILVDDPGDYLIEHVKGISQHVQDDEIPVLFLPDYLEAKEQIEDEHIDDDLESERVTALYLMNHYLKARDFAGDQGLINTLIKSHWDHGPISVIESWMKQRAQPYGEVIELGCGAGGVLPAIQECVGYYLGVDSSFASIASARKFGLGLTTGANLRIPDDLINGTLSRIIATAFPPIISSKADFIVADALSPPVVRAGWDYAISLNMMDMIDEPRDLIQVQHDLLRTQGVAIQTGPYIWSAAVAQHIRETLAIQAGQSAQVVERLYRDGGFSILKVQDQIPWLFYKHLRQLEIYLVHFIAAQK